jgi:hypothetical protein
MTPILTSANSFSFPFKTKKGLQERITILKTHQVKKAEIKVNKIAVIK